MISEKFVIDKNTYITCSKFKAFECLTFISNLIKNLPDSTDDNDYTFSRQGAEFLIMNIMDTGIDIKISPELKNNYKGLIDADYFAVLLKKVFINSDIEVQEKIKNDLLIKEKNIIEERMNNLSLNLEIKSKTEKEFLLRLKKIKKDKNYETEEIIKDLHLSISSLLNIDKKQYLELEKNNKINDSFIQKIKLDFPLLTPQEIQLCGYVHLSLSNKEIALLENITAPSVRVYKTRLKAKLGLSKEQDLETFLKTIYL